jgi:hypothetical protein
MLSNEQLFNREVRNIGPGWQKIARVLHLAILEVYPNYTLIQIKEKLGSMRYYIDHSEIPQHLEHLDKIILDLVSAAEKSTFYICSNCGGPREILSEFKPAIRLSTSKCRECK